MSVHAPPLPAWVELTGVLGSPLEMQDRRTIPSRTDDRYRLTHARLHAPRTGRWFTYVALTLPTPQDRELWCRVILARLGGSLASARPSSYIVFAAADHHQGWGVAVWAGDVDVVATTTPLTPELERDAAIMEQTLGACPRRLDDFLPTAWVKGGEEDTTAWWLGPYTACMTPVTPEEERTQPAKMTPPLEEAPDLVTITDSQGNDVGTVPRSVIRRCFKDDWTDHIPDDARYVTVALLMMVEACSEPPNWSAVYEFTLAPVLFASPTPAASIADIQGVTRVIDMLGNEAFARLYRARSEGVLESVRYLNNQVKGREEATTPPFQEGEIMYVLRLYAHRTWRKAVDKCPVLINHSVTLFYPPRPQDSAWKTIQQVFKDHSLEAKASESNTLELIAVDRHGTIEGDAVIHARASSKTTPIPPDALPRRMQTDLV